MNTGTKSSAKTELSNEQFTLISKALSDPNRLQIIEMITSQERCACKLLEHFNISQPTLSHHMRILSDCNLIQTRKDGKWSHYSMNIATMEAFKNYVDLMYEAALASASTVCDPCESRIAC
jgi:ArsR family transcriptional regulator, arsenate/arsenite/antimonite-responsive transcriptional repressor